MLPAASSLDLLMQFPEVMCHRQKHRFHKHIGIAPAEEAAKAHVRLDVGKSAFRLDASIDSQPYSFIRCQSRLRGRSFLMECFRHFQALRPLF